MSDQSADSNEPQFIEDGHLVRVVWDKDDIKIAGVFCPNSGVTAICNRRRNYCVVDRFLQMQGFEANIGRTVVQNPVEIAWVPVLGECDIDDEFQQVWVIPVDDPSYVTFKEFGQDEPPDGDSPPESR